MEVNMNQETLRKRTKKFMEELRLPKSRLAKTLDFERSSYYKWINGDFDFGERRAAALDDYLKKFGF